jgi:hypothetical protein
MAGGRIAKMAKWARRELAANWDTDVAIVLGIIVGVLGIFEVTNLKITVGMVLVALAAVAGSLHRDRALREKLDTTVEQLDSRLTVVSRALSSPLPYEVISGHYKWDFQIGGKTAIVTKKARIRFVHNGVWTILQWHTRGADVCDLAAHRVTEQGLRRRLNVLDGPADPPQQRVGRLVTLDHECRQNEVLDFEYGFVSQGNFDGGQEWLKTDIETSTGDLTVELVWADDRKPRSIWRMDDGERIPLSVERAGERHRTKLKLQHLARGQKVLIEWDWIPIEDLEVND